MEECDIGPLHPLQCYDKSGIITICSMAHCLMLQYTRNELYHFQHNVTQDTRYFLERSTFSFIVLDESFKRYN